MYKPRIAITMGDPGGIGLEVFFKAINSYQYDWPFHPILIVPNNVLEHPYYKKFIDYLSIKKFKNESLLKDQTLYTVDPESRIESFQIGKHTHLIMVSFHMIHSLKH